MRASPCPGLFRQFLAAGVTKPLSDWMATPALHSSLKHSCLSLSQFQGTACQMSRSSASGLAARRGPSRSAASAAQCRRKACGRSTRPLGWSGSATATNRSGRREEWALPSAARRHGVSCVGGFFPSAAPAPACCCSASALVTARLRRQQANRAWRLLRWRRGRRCSGECCCCAGALAPVASG